MYIQIETFTYAITSHKQRRAEYQTEMLSRMAKQQFSYKQWEVEFERQAVRIKATRSALRLCLHSVDRTFIYTNFLLLWICITCTLIVTTRQEALQCDGCQKWQHRVCNTGISRPEYRNAVRAGTDIPWECQTCVVSHMPNFESTRFDEGKSAVIVYS